MIDIKKIASLLEMVAVLAAAIATSNVPGIISESIAIIKYISGDLTETQHAQLTAQHPEFAQPLTQYRRQAQASNPS